MMLLLFMACAIPEFPAGWEDATLIEDFEQAKCEDTGMVTLSATAEGDGVRLEAGPVSARCSQELEAYWQPTDAGAEVLIQPVNMHPEMVGKCGSCNYDLSMLVPTAAPAAVDVYQRGDFYGESNPEVHDLGTATAE